MLAAASLVAGLGLLLVAGLACLLPPGPRRLDIWPCHIRMPEDLRGPTMPEAPRPGRPGAAW